MKKIVYYVASSIDGYISGPNDDVSGFIYDGNGAEKYLDDLKYYKTVIMGRNTYEFGYKFGAKAGQPSPTYPHMMHYIFSDHLQFDNKSAQVEVKPLDIEEVKQIKKTSITDIYLCGGGMLAGWLLDNKLLDVVKVKLNPLIIGNGTKIFENVSRKYQLEFVDNNSYGNGLQILTFNVTY